MSMTATFIAVEASELTGLRADPGQAEALFAGPTVAPTLEAIRERAGASLPASLVGLLSGLNPALRRLLETRRSSGSDASSAGRTGEAILKNIEARLARTAGTGGERPVLGLEKAWHGVHYLLSGRVDPAEDPLASAILGGEEIGSDEGFSGYGPPRAFDPQRVAEIAAALANPGLERTAAARFDSERMNRLGLYPGFRADDAEWLMEGLRRLRGFYAAAAANGQAIVTCLL